ncbi:unnamed protein product [Ceutorhynchus assimilis]|uniref:Deoxyuridine 5'-triphosphate nucleotidohydrolase n=1 Tax=Ceutorhynchus assimilis TaxID=467358 RepID=A0A9N9MMT5_9CUCU|nr:unnamed protein product [Ceutorhynchus assimilis]
MSNIILFPRYLVPFFTFLSKIGGKSLFPNRNPSTTAFSSCLSYCKYRNFSTTMPSVSSEKLKYTKVLPDAFPPTKGSLKAAGYDLKSAVDINVKARGKALVDTGLRVELPEGCYGRIAPRSGLAVKNFIDVGAGVVDEDYRGVLKVVLFNHSDEDFEVKKGDRIAQLICEKIYYPELEEVQELTNTERGAGGFGSTGTN